jgi:hypothetical protein
MKTLTKILVLTAVSSVVLALILSMPAHAQLRGLTGSTPYVLPVDTRT